MRQKKKGKRKGEKGRGKRQENVKGNLNLIMGPFGGNGE